VLAHLHLPSGAPPAPDEVVGIFPRRDSLMRMVGALLADRDDEGQVADRRNFSVGSTTKVDALEGGEDPKELPHSDRVRSVLKVHH